jgi:dTDP-4-amino-4,6-dideoxygalactose transaminase
VTYEQVGYNSRLDELQAAILRVQLPHLDEWADGRRQAGSYYVQSGLGEIVRLPKPVEGSAPAWHLYVVADEQVECLEAALKSAQIGYKPYYRTPVHRQAAMREWGAGVELPATEQAAQTHLAIPMSPALTREQADEVVAAARRKTELNRA